MEPHGAGREPEPLAATLTVTGAEAVIVPASSVARAVRRWWPGGTWIQLNLYGGVVAVPRRVLPEKKSTRAMGGFGVVAREACPAVSFSLVAGALAGEPPMAREPLVALTVASRSREPGAMRQRSAAGPVSVTRGGAAG